MCVYIYIYIYIYIYLSLYIYIYLSLSIYIYIIYIYICVCVCVHIYTHKYKYKHPPATQSGVIGVLKKITQASRITTRLSVLATACVTGLTLFRASIATYTQDRYR